MKIQNSHIFYFLDEEPAVFTNPCAPSQTKAVVPERNATYSANRA
jgi:hypothetical protein